MGKHYDARNSIMKCEAFLDYETEGALLRAVANWWRYQKIEGKAMDHIRIIYDSASGISAEVHWNHGK